jgi:hypothetical protein
VSCLRFTCEGTAHRVTYYIDVQRKITTLTTFRKQRQNERREAARARKAMRAASKQEVPMADITQDELRAKYPPEDQEEYDRA